MPIASPTGAAQRAVPRHKVFAPATLSLGGTAHRAHILDVSPLGVQVDSEGAGARPGRIATLQWEGGEHRLLVCWARRSRFGGRFISPLAAATLEALLAQGGQRVASRPALG